MPPVPSTLTAPPVPAPAPAQIGRYTVDSQADPGSPYVTWCVKLQGAIPGGAPHIEAIAIDRSRAIRIAGALAAVDAIKKLLPRLNALANEDGADPELQANLTDLARALGFMRLG